MKKIIKIMSLTLVFSMMSVVSAVAVPGDLDSTTTVDAGTGVATAGEATGTTAVNQDFNAYVQVDSAQAGDTVVVTPTITDKPAASVLTVSDLTLTVSEGDDFASSSVASGVVTLTAGATDGGAPAEINYSFTPDAAGDFEFTLTSTGDGDETNLTVTYLVTVSAAAGTATAIAVSKTTEDDGVDLATGYYTSNPVRDANQISAFTVDAGSSVEIETTAVGGTFTTDDKIKIEMVGYGIVVASNSPTTTAAGSEDVSPAFTAPSVPGTYTLRLTLAKSGTYAVATDLVTEVSMKVEALSSFSTGVSTVYINDNAGAAGTATTDAAGASGVKTVSTIAANISVDLERANGDDYASGTFYAFVDGPGLIDIVADNTDFNGNLTDASTCTALCRSDSLASDGLFNIAVYADGTTGVGTIKSYIILADGATRVDLPAKKVSFYGDIAKLEATVHQAIATPGIENGNCTALTDCTFATLAETPAVTIKATDSSGVLVPDASLTAEIADSTIVGASSVSAASGATDYNGDGFYNASVTGGSAALIGKSTTVKYYVTISGVKLYSNAVTISLAGTPRTVTWSLDKTSYEPGAKVVITVTAKDAAGNPAADGTYANLFAGATVASGSITGSTPAASVELVGGKKEYTAFAPGTGGNYTITNTTGSSAGAGAGTALTGTVVVNNPNAALLTQIDALNAKIVALNALIAKIMKKLGVK